MSNMNKYLILYFKKNHAIFNWIISSLFFNKKTLRKKVKKQIFWFFYSIINHKKIKKQINPKLKAI